MGRTVISQKDKEGTPKPERVEKDSYAEQILKYIPAEVVAFYLPALATAAVLPKGSTDTDSAIVSSPYGNAILVIFLVALGATFVYMYKSAKKDLEEKKVVDPTLRATIKAGISTIAFIIWALYIGGIFEFVTMDHSTFGTLGILFFTLISPPLYDALVSRLTMPPSITMEYKHSSNGTTPAGTNSFFATNLSPKDTEVISIELYWKNWKSLFRYAPESFSTVKLPIKTGQRKEIDKKLYFRKRGVTHILKIRTQSGHVATSEPFQD